MHIENFDPKIDINKVKSFVDGWKLETKENRGSFTQLVFSYISPADDPVVDSCSVTIKLMLLQKTKRASYEYGIIATYRDDIHSYTYKNRFNRFSHSPEQLISVVLAWASRKAFAISEHEYSDIMRDIWNNFDNINKNIPIKESKQINMGSMKLHEEFKLYENMWESVGTSAVVFVGNRRNKKALLDKVAKTNLVHTTMVLSVSDFLRQYENANKDVVKFYTDAEGKAELEKACADMPERMRKPILNAATLIESVETAALPSDGYRVVLADYDTDDFDINVEFGMQDPDENEVVDYEYLLKPGQTRGDLVVYLSDNCGFTSIYVHDERPATATDVKRLSSETFPVTDTGDEYKYYGDID